MCRLQVSSPAATACLVLFSPCESVCVCVWAKCSRDYYRSCYQDIARCLYVSLSVCGQILSPQQRHNHTRCSHETLKVCSRGCRFINEGWVWGWVWSRQGSRKSSDLKKKIRMGHWISFRCQSVVTAVEIHFMPAYLRHMTSEEGMPPEDEWPHYREWVCDLWGFLCFFINMFLSSDLCMKGSFSRCCSLCMYSLSEIQSDLPHLITI